MRSIGPADPRLGIAKHPGKRVYGENNSTNSKGYLTTFGANVMINGVCDLGYFFNGASCQECNSFCAACTGGLNT